LKREIRKHFLWAAGPRAIVENIGDQIYGISDITLAIVVGVTEIKRAWRRTAIEYISDNKHCIAYITTAVAVGITAYIAIFRRANQVFNTG
jgi:hypothetical protein